MTIYLFGKISGVKIVNRRASAKPEPRDESETHIATLKGQPDNYFELIRSRIDPAKPVELDP